MEPEIDGCAELGLPGQFGAEAERVRHAYARRSFSNVYSLFEPATLLAGQERERKLLQRLAEHGFHNLANRKILEVGCGAGNWLRDFIRWGACPENIRGIDLLPETIAIARQLCPPGIMLECGNAAKLEIDSGSFDLVLQSTVFTSILDRAMKRQIAGEMRRVLAPGGVIVWYDFCFDNPRNSDVRGVGRAEIRQLFPGCQIDLERITLAPPIGRFVARRSRLLYQLLSFTRFCSTHLLGIIRRGRA